MPTQWPVVKCPDCNVPMGVKLVTTDNGTTKVTYACVICKTETVREHKVPEQPPTPSP